MHNMYWICICIFAAFVTFSDALRCYDCRYDEGSSFQSGCENNPGSEFSVEVPKWPYPSSRHGSSYSGQNMGMFDVHHNVHKWPVSIPEERFLYWYCMKITGRSNGRRTVIRGFAYAVVHGGHEVCESRLPPNLESLGLTDVRTCYCDTRDNCNSSAAMKWSAALIVLSVVLALLKK